MRWLSCSLASFSPMASFRAGYGKDAVARQVHNSPIAVSLCSACHQQNDALQMYQFVSSITGCCTSRMKIRKHVFCVVALCPVRMSSSGACRCKQTVNGHTGTSAQQARSRLTLHLPNCSFKAFCSCSRVELLAKNPHDLQRRVHDAAIAVSQASYEIVQVTAEACRA